MPRHPESDRRPVTLEECQRLWGVDAKTLGRRLFAAGISPVDYVDRDGRVIPTPPVPGTDGIEMWARYAVGDCIAAVLDSALTTPVSDARWRAA